MNPSDKNVAENSTPAPEAETPVLAPVVPEKDALNKVETKDVVPDALDTAPDTDPVAESSAGQKPGLKDAASPDDTQDDQEDAKSEPPATSAGSDPQSEFLYTLTADQHRKATKYCAGAAKAWDTEHSKKDGTLLVGNADPWVLARALLAVADQQLTQSTTDRHAEIEVWALLNNGWLKRAYQVARADHEFMYKSYRVYIQKGSFDKYNDVGRTEERTQLNQASAWTLVKAFRAQFLAAVNVVMPRNTRNTPLTAYAAEENPKDSKQAAKQAARRKPKCDTAKRTPEECSWNGRSDSHLMQILYDLMDSHNGALATKADLSEYYKYAGWLRRQERKGNCRDASGFQNVKSSGSRDSNSSRGSNRSRGNRAGGNRSGGNRGKGKGSDGQRKTRYTGKPAQTGTKSSGRVKIGNA